MLSAIKTQSQGLAMLNCCLLQRECSEHILKLQGASKLGIIYICVFRAKFFVGSGQLFIVLYEFYCYEIS